MKSIKNNFYLFQIGWKACPWYIILYFGSEILRSLYNVIFSVYFSKVLFNSLGNSTFFKDVFLTLAIFIFFGSIFYVIFALSENYLYPKMFPKIRNYMMTILFDKVNSVDIACFENTEFYNKYTIALSEANRRVTDIINEQAEFVAKIISIIVMLAFIFSLSIPAMLIAVIPIAIVMILNLKLNKINHAKYMDDVEPRRKYDYTMRVSYLREYTKEMKTSKISNVIFNHLNKSVEDLNANIKKYGRTVGSLYAIWNILANVIPVFLSYVYAIYLYLFKQTLLVGDFLSLTIAITNFEWAIYSISQYITNINKNSLYIQQLRDFLDYVPEIYEYQDGYKPSSMESITLNNISFSYPDGTQALNNINFNIKKGEHIAIVGYNGSGKTTLVKLLMRLWDVSNGEILYNGKNIKEYNLQDYRDLYGTIFQDYELFAMDIAENVLMRGYDENNDAELIKDALIQGGIYDKVNSLPNGIHTQLTKEFDEDGIYLSGGEMQKIAIARTFAKDFQIGIFDEPTSALDPVSEHEFFQRIYEVAEDKTVIFISHRLSSTIMADRIYMMENGDIIETGTHDELMMLNGKYAEMFSIQAESYRKEAISL